MRGNLIKNSEGSFIRRSVFPVGFLPVFDRSPHVDTNAHFDTNVKTLNFFCKDTSRAFYNKSSDKFIQSFYLNVWMNESWSRTSIHWKKGGCDWRHAPITYRKVRLESYHFGPIGMIEKKGAWNCCPNMFDFKIWPILEGPCSREEWQG